MLHLIKKVLHKIERKVKKISFTLSLIFHKNCFVFGMPFHSNAGDQAQSFCIENWIKDNYPKYRIRWFDAFNMSKTHYSVIKTIKRVIKKEDIIFLHSGYHTTDLYLLEELLQREVIKSFPEHRIIILPQTINYTSEKEKRNSIEIYNAHKDLLLFCRDDVSFSMAQELFPSCRLFLFPDIVTTLIGKYKYNNKRNGILLCMRNDKESFFTQKERDALIQNLSNLDSVQFTDTTINIDANYFIENRKSVLEDMWDEYSKYRVVVTDRYHGTIFSLIAGTPVVVIPSTDHKLKSGVDWFPPEFSDYIQYVPIKSNIANCVSEVLDKQLNHELPAFFQEKYYSKLKMLIEED